jgi:hypothetical protein
MNRFVLGALVGLAAALIVLRLSRRRPAPTEPIEPGSAEEQALP